jgi:hypothetical protein
VKFDREHFLAFASKLSIPSKQGGDNEKGEHVQLVPLIPIPTQTYFLDNLEYALNKNIRFLVCLKCLAPWTRVLTSDLRWVPIGEIQVGDELLGFDEHVVEERSKKRTLQPSKVLDKWSSKQPAWKISFDDHNSVTCSAHHKFLVQKRGGVDYRWYPVFKLRPGDRIKRVVNPWPESDYEDGWAGGFIDGEGSVHNTTGQGVRVSVYQRDNPALHQYRQYLESRSISYYEAIDTRTGEYGAKGKQGKTPVHLTATGNLPDALKLIGLTRPVRFVNEHWWKDKNIPGGVATIDSINFAGEIDLIDIETSTSTFVAEGLSTHNCRQSGLTTLGLALDLYWCFMIKGLVHNFVGDIPKVTEINRSLCRDFVDSLQAYPEWHYTIRDDNSDIMAFSNRSKIIWHVANKRKGGQLGRSIGAAAAHGTELGNWEDIEGADSFMSSLAETNVNSLFLWEGTASGPGFFQELCKGAMGPGNSTEHFCFIGWWLHPWYRVYPDRYPEHRQIFDVYWTSNSVLSREEVIWVEGVKRRFSYQIAPEQIAWWRWHLKQRKGGNIEYMYQEYPPLPEYAWRYGARSFISASILSERRTIIQETRNEEESYYRFSYGNGVNFEDSDLHRVDPEKSYWDLVMFDLPQPPHDLLRYVIGVDPVHGADEQSNDAAVQVFCCYTDCYVQVAEFVQNELSPFKLAWVVLHLAALYQGNPMLCTELLGGGYELQNEIRRLQNGLAHGYSKTLELAFSGLQHYTWTRPDQRKPTNQTLHYKTTPDSKEMMLQAMKHYFERKMMIVRSPRLLAQMEGMSWTKDGDIDAPRPNDLLMAAGFATMAYKQVLDTDIGGTGHTRAKWEEKLRQSKGVSKEQFITNMLTNWADQRTMQANQEQKNEDLIEYRERRDDIADRWSAERWTR